MLEERVFRVQLSSVAQSCSTLWPHGLQHTRTPVHRQLLELAQTHVHRVSDAIQPSHPLSSSSPPAFNLHQSLTQWVSFSHHMAKVLELQLSISLSNEHSGLKLPWHSEISSQLYIWTVACQASLSMGFSRQEYWSGLPCPPLGDLPDPQTYVPYISCIGRQTGSLQLALSGKVVCSMVFIKYFYKKSKIAPGFLCMILKGWGSPMR